MVDEDQWAEIMHKAILEEVLGLAADLLEEPPEALTTHLAKTEEQTQLPCVQ